MPSINAKCQEAQNYAKKHNYAKYGNIESCSANLYKFVLVGLWVNNSILLPWQIGSGSVSRYPRNVVHAL